MTKVMHSRLANRGARDRCDDARTRAWILRINGLDAMRAPHTRFARGFAGLRRRVHAAGRA
jgi:hypothetical protein